ncbi:hypothetical protein HPB50_000657 [Hyalomma asiaticum]|uniref:Uncharacterized protein n=1 Tax=Hyalomma asiaticum TaxID=266040 RepID=A0ACB7T9K6_HYAAI|nr:hypothetical protein HPB50_000657 [Hyalomma asiaticum]
MAEGSCDPTQFPSTWRRSKFQYFKDMGVPGPRPSLIFGNLLEIKRRGGAAMFAEWIKTYGNVVGFYNGAIPFLLVNDLELLKRVEIEDFHNFAERGNVIEVQSVPDIRQKLIVTAPVNRWREMRAVLSPAFTTKKLSQIFVIMDDCSDTMIELLHGKVETGEAVEVSKVFRRATMDTMFKVGYGVDLNVQHSTPGGPLDQMGDGAGALLRRVPLQGISFLSRFDGKTRLAITREEVIANSAFYLIAGLEATPNTMGLTLHLLALHPEIQDRLQAEISEVLHRDGKFTYKNVMEMPYMDMVLNESMRFYTGVVGFVTRRAARDFEYKDVKIPRGLSVMVPVTYLHHDPEVWHEPEKFDPERFSPGNKPFIHPVSFQPFGKGPRECLGKNFALLEMKLMLSKFLANFRVTVDERHHKQCGTTLAKMSLAKVTRDSCRCATRHSSSFASAWLAALVALSTLMPLSRGQCLSYVCYKQCRNSGRGPGTCVTLFYHGLRYMACACADTIDYHLADQKHYFVYGDIEAQPMQHQQQLLLWR